MALETEKQFNAFNWAELPIEDCVNDIVEGLAIDDN